MGLTSEQRLVELCCGRYKVRMCGQIKRSPGLCGSLLSSCLSCVSQATATQEELRLFLVDGFCSPLSLASALPLRSAGLGLNITI